MFIFPQEMSPQGRKSPNSRLESQQSGMTELSQSDRVSDYIPSLFSMPGTPWSFKFIFSPVRQRENHQLAMLTGLVGESMG